MKTLPLLAASALALALALAACGDRNDAAEDRIEAQAEASAAASGPAVVALGLTEAQLLDAELISTNGEEIGDVAQVLRGPTGSVDRLLVEIEDSHPDRFVEVSLAGLSPLVRGDDTDLSTSITKTGLEALPAVLLQP